MREMWLLFSTGLPQKLTGGLQHGQPAQRTLPKVIFDGFPLAFHPSWSQSSQNGVAILQLMFLYEGRAHAPRTGTSSAQLGPHFGPLSVKLERTGAGVGLAFTASWGGQGGQRPGRHLPPGPKYWIPTMYGNYHFEVSGPKYY